MVTVGEVIQRVQSLYSKGVQSDDSRLTPMHIYSVVLSIRSLLLQQKINKKQNINDWNYQVLSCIELEEISAIDCDCLNIKSNCKVYKSKHKIPDIISGLNEIEVKYVQSLDGSILYNKTTEVKQRYKKGSRYNKKSYDYIIKNGYLITFDLPKYVKLSALFQNPIEAGNFNFLCKGIKDCKSNYEKEFHISEDLLPALIELSAKELINVFTKMQEDLTNNSKDNLTEISK